MRTGQFMFVGRPASPHAPPPPSQMRQKLQLLDNWLAQLRPSTQPERVVRVELSGAAQLSLLGARHAARHAGEEGEACVPAGHAAAQSAPVIQGGVSAACQAEAGPAGERLPPRKLDGGTLLQDRKILGRNELVHKVCRRAGIQKRVGARVGWWQR